VESCSPCGTETPVIPVVVITRGHPFDASSFFAMWDALPDVSWRHLEHPHATEAIARGEVDESEVLCFYDMPGIEFERGVGARLIPPPAAYVEGLTRLADAATPMLFLHHAIAGWPAWAEYADWIGGRFLYEPTILHDIAWPDSGYRHEVAQTLTVVDGAHPVTAGLPAHFDLVDETYLCPVFTDNVTPLLRTSAPRTDDEFYSAALAVRGELHSRRDWHHPRGSDLAAWTKPIRASTAVYVQPGDGPSAYENKAYRQLLANSVSWLASTRTR
jgi:uncharacterized protein